MSDGHLIAAPSVSLRRQLRAVEAEVMRRRRTYPQLVVCGRLSARTAKSEIAAMEAAAATLLALMERMEP